jgi:hypothetical protein
MYRRKDSFVNLECFRILSFRGKLWNLFLKISYTVKIMFFLDDTPEKKVSCEKFFHLFLLNK